jgi:hypothetical protein
MVDGQLRSADAVFAGKCGELLLQAGRDAGPAIPHPRSVLLRVAEFVLRLGDERIVRMHINHTVGRKALSHDNSFLGVELSLGSTPLDTARILCRLGC